MGLASSRETKMGNGLFRIYGSGVGYISVDCRLVEQEDGL